MASAHIWSKLNIYQPVILFISIILELRQVVADLTQKVEQTKEKDSKEDVSERIYTELQSIKNFTEDAWAQNPYRQRNFYEKQVKTRAQTTININ